MPGFQKIADFTARLEGLIAQQHPQPGQVTGRPPASFPLGQQLLSKGEGRLALETPAHGLRRGRYRVLAKRCHIGNFQPLQQDQVDERRCSTGNRILRKPENALQALGA